MDFDFIFHPMVVHFPIALFISALGVEVLSLVFKKDAWHQTALHLYVLATLTAPFAVMTGLREADELQLKHRVLDLHKNFGLLTMGISLVSLAVLWFFSKKNPAYFRIVFIVVLLLAVGFVSLTGFNGGRLVYEYGVGIADD